MNQRLAREAIRRVASIDFKHIAQVIEYSLQTKAPISGTSQDIKQMYTAFSRRDPNKTDYYPNTVVGYETTASYSLDILEMAPFDDVLLSQLISLRNSDVAKLSDALTIQANKNTWPYIRRMNSLVFTYHEPNEFFVKFDVQKIDTSKGQLMLSIRLRVAPKNPPLYRAYKQGR
jgi:hypothetical protein